MALNLSRRGLGDTIFEFINHPGYFMTFFSGNFMLRLQPP
jgi:hypothetical protein